MGSNEVNVIALVENLELMIPGKLPAATAARIVHNVTEQLTQATKTTPGSETQVTNVLDLSNKDTNKGNLQKRSDMEIDGKSEDAAVEKRAAASPNANNNVNTTTTTGETTCSSLPILGSTPPDATSSAKQVQQTVAVQDNNDTSKRETANAQQQISCGKRARRFAQRMRGGRKTLEVRRNPMRASTRNKDTASSSSSSNFASTRRLLAGRRRTNSGQQVSNNSSMDTDESSAAVAATIPTTSSVHQGSKRSTTTIPYMNTRSVTRKLGNVGAMHEAPTRRDEAEWREWPVHGMHERPVYHQQFGLAAEYNGRLFASFDGEGYREIGVGREPQIEIVRVDPRIGSHDASMNNVANHHQSPSQRSRLAALEQLQHARNSMMRDANLCQNLALNQRQIDHLRNLERLRHYENLQRLCSRVQLKQSAPSETITSAQQQQQYRPKLANRIISKEALRSLYGNATHRPNASKCVILPRASVAPVTVPLCGVQAIKSSDKGKFYFVKASDAPVKATAEKPTMLNLASTIPTRTFTISNSSSGGKIIQQQQQQQSVKLAKTNYTPIRLVKPATTSRSVKSQALSDCTNLVAMRKCAADASYRVAKSDEVLDLSKKVVKREDSGDAKALRNHATDLVRYFQNFGADESADTAEVTKNLT